MLTKEEINELIIEEITKRKLDFKNTRLKIQYSNLYNYFQAKLNMSAKSFTIHLPDDVCPSCKKLYPEGEWFPIKQIDLIPPLCNECICIPHFSMKTPEELNKKTILGFLLF